MGKLTISIASFNSYVKLPEGKWPFLFGSIILAPKNLRIWKKKLAENLSQSHGLVATTAPENPALIHWPLNAIDTTRDMTHTQSIQTGALDEAAKIPNIAILVAEFNGAMDKRLVNPCF